MTDSPCAIHRYVDSANLTTQLFLSGWFERPAERELRRALYTALALPRSRSLILDMDGVVLIGDECVGTLLHGYTRALRAGRGYEIVNAHGQVRHALEASSLCARTDDDALYVPAWPDVLEFTAAG